MLTNKWVKWEPLHNLSQKYVLHTMSCSADNAEIVLADRADNTKKILIQPTGLVLSCTKTSICFKEQTIKMLNENYGETFISSWSFFKITNSTYVNWFTDESCSFFEAKNFYHFIFVTPNEVIELVTADIPSAEYVDIE